jgi:hypothetical protein
MTAVSRAVEVLFTVLQLGPIIALSIQYRSVNYRLTPPSSQDNSKQTTSNSLASQPGHLPSGETSSANQHTKEVHP